MQTLVKSDNVISTHHELITLKPQGLYSAEGDFYIDAWKPRTGHSVVVTHGHADHAHSGHQHYICSPETADILKIRLGPDTPIEILDYNTPKKMGDTWMSLHPAGHILGSAQVRVEHKNKVCVFSGDYKRTPDPSCKPFEPVECDTFISEATFALPIYHWDTTDKVVDDIYKWWKSSPDVTSVLFCYSLGKAQRILAELSRLTNETIYVHGSSARITDVYRKHNISMPPTQNVMSTPPGFDFRGKLVLAPPSAHRSSWLKRFKKLQTGFASGWMQIRGNKRRRNIEHGFVVSDHADWQELFETFADTKAKRIYLTHGKTDAVVRYLNEQGKEAYHLKTQFDDEDGDGAHE